jgi:hypothetical protein
VTAVLVLWSFVMTAALSFIITYTLIPDIREAPRTPRNETVVFLVPPPVIEGFPPPLPDRKPLK